MENILNAILIVLVGLSVGLAAGIGRLLYGGAPHFPDWSKLPEIRQLPGWLPSAATYPLFFLLGMATLYLYTPQDGWPTVGGCAIVAAILSAGWNPGHGSYLNPGNGSLDNEVLFNKLVPLIAVKSSPGSVSYCCIGMAVRYGLISVLTAGAMFLTNMYLNTEFSLWYALVGWLAGPWMYVCHKTNWWQKDTPDGWYNHNFHNGPFEEGIGWIMFGGLFLVHAVL